MKLKVFIISIFLLFIGCIERVVETPQLFKLYSGAIVEVGGEQSINVGTGDVELINPIEVTLTQDVLVSRGYYGWLVLEENVSAEIDDALHVDSVKYKIGHEILLYRGNRVKLIDP